MLTNSMLIGAETIQTPGLQSYREQILQQLLLHKTGLSINDLGDVLGISRTAVQKHFGLLEKDGLIKKLNSTKTQGRPSANYVLTNLGMAYFPKRYALFSKAMLTELKTELGAEQFSTYFQKLGKKLAAQYQSRFAGQSQQTRLEQLIALMQELGFYPSISQQPDHVAMDINASNCIYHELAQEFHEICMLDQTLIAELLNTPVELPSCIAKGDNACCFRVCLKK